MSGANKRSRIGVGFLLALVLLVGTGCSEVSPDQEATANEVFHRLEALFQGYAIIQGEFDAETKEAQRDSSQSPAVQKMATLVSLTDSLRRAAELLPPNANALDKNIELGISNVERGYKLIEAVQKQQIARCEGLINNPALVNGREGDLLRAFKEEGVFLDNQWMSFSQDNVTLMTFLVDEERVKRTGHANFLKITSAQREQLRSDLLVALGDSVKKEKLEDNDSYLTGVGKIWWKQLSDEGWATVDDSDLVADAKFWWATKVKHQVN